MKNYFQSLLVLVIVKFSHQMQKNSCCRLYMHTNKCNDVTNQVNPKISLKYYKCLRRVKCNWVATNPLQKQPEVRKGQLLNRSRTSGTREFEHISSLWRLLHAVAASAVSRFELTISRLPTSYVIWQYWELHHWIGRLQNHDTRIWNRFNRLKHISYSLCNLYLFNTLINSALLHFLPLLLSLSARLL